MRKTKLQLEVEARENRGNIEQWLPAMVEELGYYRTAAELGINKGTVERWMHKMGLNTVRKVVPVGGRSDDILAEGAGRD